MDIPTLITGIADMFGCMIEILNAVEFSEETVDSFEGGAHDGFEIEDLKPVLGDGFCHMAIRIIHQILFLDALFTMAVIVRIRLR